LTRHFLSHIAPHNSAAADFALYGKPTRRGIAVPGRFF
jgi:hypothetical protein